MAKTTDIDDVCRLYKLKGIDLDADEGLFEMIFDILSDCKPSDISKAVRHIITKSERLPDNPVNAIIRFVNPSLNPDVFTNTILEKARRDGHPNNFNTQEMKFYCEFGSWNEFNSTPAKDMKFKAKSFLERICQDD